MSGAQDEAAPVPVPSIWAQIEAFTQRISRVEDEGQQRVLEAKMRFEDENKEIGTQLDLQVQQLEELNRQEQEHAREIEKWQQKHHEVVESINTLRASMGQWSEKRREVKRKRGDTIRGIKKECKELAEHLFAGSPMVSYL